MSREYRRMQIIESILAMINTANIQEMGVDENKLIAYCCLNFYCGERLIKEILKNLKLTEKIIKKDDGLWINIGNNQTLRLETQI